MKKYFLLLLFIIQGLHAQVEFKALPSKTTLGINEKLSVTFSMNGDGDNFDPPSFKGFSVSGPTQTISHPIVNKKQTYLKTYTYILSPKSRGTFTIEQASIEIDGKIYKTIPFKVTVTAAVQGPGAPDGPVPSKIGDGIHIVAEASNLNPYFNEAVLITFKIYVDEDTDVSNYRQMDSPQYNGFWNQDIPFRQTLEQEMYQGRPYRAVTLEKAIIYPQKTGKLEIEPISVNVDIAVPTGRRDQLGRDVTRIVQKVFSSEKVTFTVKPLPEEGKPAGFKGAVGDFTFDVSPSKTTVASGESFRLDVSVSGNGNFKFFDLPKPVVPAAFDMYEPEETDNLRTTTQGMQGTFNNVYTIVPQYKGTFTVKPVSFSFFDPRLNTYRTIYSKEIVIDVPTGPDATASAYQDATGTKKLPENNNKSKPDETGTGTAFLGSAAFYVLLGLLLGLGIMAIILIKKSKGKKNAKENKIDRPQPYNLAKSYLTEARAQLGNKEPFYVALEKALHNFLKAKLAIETSQMTKQNIRELLIAKGAERTTVEQYTAVMDNCAFARYAPSTGVEMQQDYNNAETAINNLEKQI